MKNKLLTIALVAVIGFSFAACDNGGATGGPSFDTTALTAVINEAAEARTGVITASNALEVPAGRKWVPEGVWNIFDSDYKAAVETRANPSSQTAVDEARTKLEASLRFFNAAKQNGSAAAITLGGTITVKNNGLIVPYVVIQAHNNDYSWAEEIRLSLTAANTPWSVITKPFSSSTDIFFEIIGYDNDKYENIIFYITVEGLSRTVYTTDLNNININQDLKFITVSGTLNIDYNGKTIPSVAIEINRKEDNLRLGTVNILNAGNNTPWSMNIPSQAVDTDVTFGIIGFDGPLPWEYDQLFAFWRRDFGVQVKNQNKTGIAINLTTRGGNEGSWWTWADNDSTATVNYSVAGDGVCTITVSGTAASERWKACAGYGYTAEAGKGYTYTFEAWTQSGVRDLDVQYYQENDDYRSRLISITGTRATYTVNGDIYSKGGNHSIQFQCADKLGTFYVKMLGITESVSVDTAALDAVIQEASIAREGVVTASNASEVPTGKFWVPQSIWDVFNSAYGTAVDAKANPASQTAVDTAKTNLQAALVIFNSQKKSGSAPAITLGGTITAKANGQPVPYVQIQAHTDDWSWEENILVSSTAANAPWSIITRPFSSPTELFFEVIGYKDDNAMFYVTVEGLSKTVYNTDVNNININLDLNLITVSGTFNMDGQTIPSVDITMHRKKDGLRLGTTWLNNARNSTSWSMNIPSQAADTDVTFDIICFDGPTPWADDQLFAFWGHDIGVKVRNQNKTDIALNFITLSGTVSVTYKGSPPPIVKIAFATDSDWLGTTDLRSPSANTPWSFIMPAFTSDTEVHISVLSRKENGEDILADKWWFENKIVKDTNVSGIVLVVGNITE